MKSTHDCEYAHLGDCRGKVTHNCWKDSSVKRSDRESLEEDLEFIVNVL